MKNIEMDKVAFLDVDGTILPEITANDPRMTSLVYQFCRRSDRMSGPQEQVAKLNRYGVRLVWNSRNPDCARPAGRLRPMNTHTLYNGAEEHRKILAECGLDQSWFYPGFPEVVHSAGKSKGEAMMAWLRQTGIPVENSIAFDNEPDQFSGYPAERVITVNSARGICAVDFRKAAALLDLFGELRGQQPPVTPETSRPSLQLQ